jgi:hypothetical protein
VLTSVLDPDSLILDSNSFLAEYQYSPKSGSGSSVLMTKNWKIFTAKIFLKLQFTHIVHLYLEYYSVCPLIGIGTLPPPISLESMPLPPVPKKCGGGHSPADEELGESEFRRLEKKLSTMSTL